METAEYWHNSKMQVKVSEKEIRAYYEEALMKESQMLINFLIREIIVFDDEIHIYFNNPLQTGPDAGQGLSVCDRETTMPAHIQNSYELRRKNIRITITIWKRHVEKEKQPKPNHSI